MDLFEKLPGRVVVHEVDDGSMGLFVKAVYERENKIVLSVEHNDYKWVTLEELLDLAPASLHLKGIEYLLKHSKRVVKYSDLV